VPRALFVLSKLTQTSLVSLPVTTVSCTSPRALAGVSVMLAMDIGPRFAGAGGTIALGVFVVVVPVDAVPDTVTGMDTLAALLSVLVLFAKIVTVVVRVGETVTDQLFPDMRVPCVRTPSTIAKTNCVCGVVTTENVMLCPCDMVERSIEKFVTAGVAKTGTAINRSANAVAAINLTIFNPIFENNLNPLLF